MTDNVDEDHFGLDDNDGNDQTNVGLSNAEHQAQARQHYTLGYHDAYDEFNESKLQAGFDDGYRSSYELCHDMGRIVGRRAAAAAMINKSNNDVAITQEEKRDRILGIMVQDIRDILASLRTASSSSLRQQKLRDLQQRLLQIVAASGAHANDTE